ncbi:hypothetical protein ACTACK_10600 [Pseudomonas syringae]|uniref:hypothetical protein n=1 Tax=Pseudomonas syringae TaxID=317 RepID=UPI003F74BA3A
MKVSISKGFRGNGGVYQFDTVTNETRSLSWSASIGGDRLIALFLGGLSVRGVISGPGPTLIKSLVGELSDSPAPATVSSLSATPVQDKNMPVSPGGHMAVAISSAGTEWVSVDFRVSPPVIRSQAVGSFPLLESIAMMSFEDGSTRLVNVNGSSGVMHLSTVIGVGAQVDTALTLGIGNVPVTAEFDAYLVNGAVEIGKLSSRARETGLGSATLIDMWLLGSNGQGGFVSARYEGTCTAPSATGKQAMAYLDGFIVKEFVTSQDYSYVTTYSKPLPDDIVSGQGFSGIFFDLPLPSDPPALNFWSKFVSAYEVI